MRRILLILVKIEESRLEKKQDKPKTFFSFLICTTILFVQLQSVLLMARTEKEKLLRDCASFLDDMFHRSLFSGIQIDLILGQNFKDGPQL